LLERLGLHPLDAALLLWFLGVSLAVGLVYARGAGRDLGEYFVSGRSLPWWALGTSMVATTFAADTPIVVSGFVLREGIAKNWIWWAFLLGGTLTVFFFAALWRRTRVLTEIELIERRYSGRAARALRGFKAIYLGLFLNSLVFGWVTLAMRRVLETLLGIHPDVALVVLVATSLLYTTFSGLWGVVATDVLQFAMAMAGSVVLAVLAVDEAGGLRALVDKTAALAPAGGGDLLALFPSGDRLLESSVLLFLLVNWWAVYYPGAEPGGGGYVAQRMLAAKDERHAVLGTLWFTLAHYALRPWPWILVGICAAALRPEFLDPSMAGFGFEPEQAYPWMMRLLPIGMRGLVLAAFFAAYMSTITTTLNLSASYVVNDFARLFPIRDAGGRLWLRLSRGTVVLVTALGVFFTWRLSSAGSGWEAAMEITAGIGLVLLLRWWWWRVNAWSEIAAMVASMCAWWILSTGAGARILHELAAGRAPLAGARERLESILEERGAVPALVREEALRRLDGAAQEHLRSRSLALREGSAAPGEGDRVRESARALSRLSSTPLWSADFAREGLDRLAAQAILPPETVAAVRAIFEGGGRGRAEASALSAPEVYYSLAGLEETQREEWLRKAQRVEGLADTLRRVFVVAFTTLVWILVTLLTPPVDRAHLARFCEDVRPRGFWGDLRRRDPADPSLGRALLLWLASAAAIFCFLFAVGDGLFLRGGRAILWGAGALVAGGIILRSMRPRG
jgi:SSS family transporter